MPKRKKTTTIPLCLMTHSDVFPTLRRHPLGWIGTIINEGQPPIAICLKAAWHRHYQRPPTHQVLTKGPRNSPYYYIDESQRRWPLVKIP